MRLRHDAYLSDIATLRARVRANGTVANLHVETVTHPASPAAVNMHINLAYEANGVMAAANGSLYTVAFGNANGTWNFNVGAIGVVLPGVPFPGNPDGSYTSFGWPMALPQITNHNLGQAVADVAAYAGAGPVPAPVLHGMARLVIAVNEATRFGTVASEVEKAIKGTAYNPPHALIHNWGGHILGA